MPTGRLKISELEIQRVKVPGLDRTTIQYLLQSQASEQWFYEAVKNHDFAAIERRCLTQIPIGQDPHRKAAAEIFGIPEEEVTAEQRRQAKTINYGHIYGDIVEKE